MQAKTYNSNIHQEINSIYTNFNISVSIASLLKCSEQIIITAFLFVFRLQGSADSNYSQPSSDLSLDEEKESIRREKERQALGQLEKARVSRSQSHAYIIMFSQSV